MELVAAAAEMEMSESAAPLWGPAEGQAKGLIGKVKDALTP
jgi:hypothetical protein